MEQSYALGDFVKHDDGRALVVTHVSDTGISCMLFPAGPQIDGIVSKTQLCKISFACAVELATGLKR